MVVAVTAVVEGEDSAEAVAAGVFVAGDLAAVGSAADLAAASAGDLVFEDSIRDLALDSATAIRIITADIMAAILITILIITTMGTRLRPPILTLRQRPL